jgi:2-oxoacid:acceptor oxidoreductase gamma subunit (pyruvate/2-ketoisovalerate family)
VWYTVYQHRAVKINGTILRARYFMVEIRFFGRGGQGAVVAAEILARSCFEAGLYSHCFSHFGGERRGSAVSSFVRVDESKIYLRCDIERPNHIVIFDESLFDANLINEQVEPGGHVLINTEHKDPLNGLDRYRVGRIDALEVSMKNGMGSIVNTAILGAYIRLTNIISLDALLKVIAENVPKAIDKNMAAARQAYEQVMIG